MSVLIDLLARTALLPLLAVQAIRVRRTALLLPEAAGPRSGTIGQGPALRVLIAGDSSAAGVGVDHQRQALSGQLAGGLSDRFTVSWRLNARTGATTRAALRALADHPVWPCDVAVLALGVNDVTRAIPRALWLRQQSRLLDRLKQDYGAKTVYVSGLPPMGEFPLLPHPLRWIIGRQAGRFDRALRRMLADRDGCRYVTLDLPMDPALMAADGFHPSAEVYAYWADTIAELIRKDYGERL